jgi:hypothetical protein
MRRLVCEYYDGFSFGAFIRKYPDLRNTITDLLIGDVFKDSVDKVWEPMETLYAADKKPIPKWNDAPEQPINADKVSELFLPTGSLRGI